MDFYNLLEEDQEDLQRCIEVEEADAWKFFRFQNQIQNPWRYSRLRFNVIFKSDEVFIINDKIHPDGWSTLIHACYWEKDDIVQILLKSGANPNYQSKSVGFVDPVEMPGCSVLTMAIKDGNPEILRMVLEAGAKVERDRGGRCPSNILNRRNYHREIRQILFDGMDFLTMTIHSIGYLSRTFCNSRTRSEIVRQIETDYASDTLNLFDNEVLSALEKAVKLGLINPRKPFTLTEEGKKIYIEEHNRLLRRYR